MSKLKVSVEEFTTPNPVTATENATLDDLNRLMKDFEIRHLPITRDGQVVGIVSDRDLRLASGLTSGEKRLVLASDLMASNPVTVSAGATLDEVAFEMSKSKIGSVIVNDENDRLLGIFTATDALNALIEIARQASRD
ncbi:MAG: CBS domain-containing protein [Bdellovibrionales bacterium]